MLFASTSKKKTQLTPSNLSARLPVRKSYATSPRGVFHSKPAQDSTMFFVASSYFTPRTRSSKNQTSNTFKHTTSEFLKRIRPTPLLSQNGTVLLLSFSEGKQLNSSPAFFSDLLITQMKFNPWKGPVKVKKVSLGRTSSKTFGSVCVCVWAPRLFLLKTFNCQRKHVFL